MERRASVSPFPTNCRCSRIPPKRLSLQKHVIPLARVAELARANDVAKIVIGLPRHMNGSVGASAQKRARLPKRSERWCHAKSGPGTSDSQPWPRIALFAKRENRARQTRGYVDQVAAQMLLQGYLDSLEHNQSGALPDSFA